MHLASRDNLRGASEAGNFVVAIGKCIAACFARILDSSVAFRVIASPNLWGVAISLARGSRLVLHDPEGSYYKTRG